MCISPPMASLFDLPSLDRATRGPVMGERTARVIWQALSDLQRPVFLWNVFPLHPFECGDPMSNRCHTRTERQACRPPPDVSTRHAAAEIRARYRPRRGAGARRPRCACTQSTAVRAMAGRASSSRDLYPLRCGACVKGRRVDPVSESYTKARRAQRLGLGIFQNRQGSDSRWRTKEVRHGCPAPGRF